MKGQLLAGVEAGGTKMVCAVANEPGVVLEEVRFPTTSPAETLLKVKKYFEEAQTKYGNLGAIGYGTFGPAVVTQGEPNYGTILPTPKLGWQGTDVLSFLSQSFPDVGLAFDTDVNVAAIGEGFSGAGRGMKNFIYITVGTGIGGGVIIEGKPLNAKPHPEIGHMLVPLIDDYKGCCSFHGACLEGLASGSAIGQRWGVPAQELSPDHEAWTLEAEYLAMMAINLVACFAPERIILGGGVMEQDFLLAKVREAYDQKTGGYWQHDSSLLVSPEMGNQAGITGALVMASEVLAS